MKVRVLVFDTETTGKPKHYGPPETDLNNYPYLVQYCGQLLEIDLDNLDSIKVIYGIDSLVKPYRDGKQIVIEPDAIKVHGILPSRANNEGNDISHVAMLHQGMCNTADFIVCHNYQFDRGVIISELLRLGITNTAKKGCMALCTMKYSEKILQIPSNGKSKYKFPSLKELYEYCTGRDINQDHKTHDAHGDVNATIISLIHLIKTEEELMSWFRGEIKTIY